MHIINQRLSLLLLRVLMTGLLGSPVSLLVPIEHHVVVQQTGLHDADVERPGWRWCRLRPSRILLWLVHAVPNFLFFSHFFEFFSQI